MIMDDNNSSNSKRSILESDVKELLTSKTEYTYEEWNQSKIMIKKLCDEGVPSNLRFLIWKHLVHNSLNVDELVVPALTPPSANSLSTSMGSIQLNDPAIHVDLNRSLNYLGISDTNGDGIEGTNNGSLTNSLTKISIPIFHNDMVTKDCSQLVQDYNLLDQIITFNVKEGFGSGGISRQYIPREPLLSPPLPSESLDSDIIANRLERFVRHFCMQTNREYSIDVVKIIIPFVVLSYVDEIASERGSNNEETANDNNQQQCKTTEQDWMNLSIKIIENLSNSALLPYSSSNPILLCESEMFRILLLYHDPVLAYFLDQRCVYSTTYFYQWINHMFSGCIDISFLVQLWDILLFHENQDFYLYFALSLLISKKEHILSVKGTSKDILLVLEEKTIVNSISNQSKLPGLVKNAQSYRSSTPVTFIRNWNKFFTNCKHPSGPRIDTINNIYKEFKYSICMGIDVEELILKSNYGKDPKIREKFQYYFQEDLKLDTNLLVFDCRPYKYFKSGRFPGSCHLPPGLLVSQPHEFEEVSKSYADMKGVAHFAFYDNWFQFNPIPTEKNDADTNDNGDMNMNILKYLKEGFPYVSRVPSGYKKIHDIFLSKGLDLAVHDQDRCPVCNPDILNNPPPPQSPVSSSPMVTPVKKEPWFNKFKIGAKRGEQSPSSPSTSQNDLSSSQKRVGLMGNLRSSQYTPTKKDKSLLTTSAESVLGLPPNSMSPFVIDEDEDEELNNGIHSGEDDFRGNPYCYGENDDGSYYYIDYTISPIITPIYDPNRVKIASELMEKALKSYQGLEDLLDGGNFVFECEEILAQGEGARERRYIILTPENTFRVLEEHPKCIGYVKLDYEYPLDAIRKIVYKKSNPYLLEFRVLENPNENNSNEVPVILTLPNAQSPTTTTTTGTEIITRKLYTFSEVDPILKAIKDKTNAIQSNSSTTSLSSSTSSLVH